jgi:hypothetical protein
VIEELTKLGKSAKDAIKSNHKHSAISNQPFPAITKYSEIVIL